MLVGGYLLWVRKPFSIKRLRGFLFTDIKSYTIKLETLRNTYGGLDCGL